MNKEQFACRCGKCGASILADGSYRDIPVDTKLVHELTLLNRSIPLIVISGFRCGDYDKICTKKSSLSAHTKGEAADITTTFSSLDKLFDYCVLTPAFSVVIRHKNYIHVSVERRGARLVKS